MPLTIDLNADAGEGFGRWRLGDEAALFTHLTSVNLACGFHAGDPSTMRRSSALALEHGLAIGAHPGYPDRVGFGRRDLGASPGQIHADVVYQIGALAAIVRSLGAELHHVKPHGALYNAMTRDGEVADAVARAVADAANGLPLVVLAGPGGDFAREAAAAVDVRTVDEAFPDRGYTRDGRLAPRSTEGAVLDDPEQIASRAVAMARGVAFPAIDGGTVRVEPATLCLHGDEPQAPETAAAVRSALEEAEITVEAFPGARPRR